VASLLLLAATIWLLRRLTALPARRVALLVFLSVTPLRANFLFGQQHLLVLALLGLAAWLDVGGRPARAGAVLAIAAALKLYPALFVLFFARRRRWRAVAGLVAAAAGLALLGLALFGWEPWRVYLVEIVPRAVLRGEVVDPYALGNTFTGLLRRLFVFEPELNPHPLVHAPAAFAVLQSTIAAALLAGGLWLVSPDGKREDPRRARLDWAWFVALLLVLFSAQAIYHLCALVLAAVLGADHLLEAGRRRQAALLVALYAAVCLPLYGDLPPEPEGWAILIAYPRLYALVAFAAVLAAAYRPLGASLSPRARPRAAAAFAVAALALAIAGTASQLRHQRGLFDDYARRLPDGGAWTASQPAVAGGDVYFTRMDAGGFSVDRSGSPLAGAPPPGTDLFHPTARAADDAGYVEVAASPASHVARFPRRAARLSPAELSTVAPDAEQPALHERASWLAFLRPRHSRRSLWLAVLDGRGGVADERELAGPEYDVLDVGFFPNGRVALSGFRDGRARLFQALPYTGIVDELRVSERPARYPAVSPDGRRLAFAEEEHGNWQLWVADLATGARRRLTGADCNATQPAWFPDGARLVYATDCGRGLGNPALAWIDAGP
jgi:hypothetical protein